MPTGARRIMEDVLSPRRPTAHQLAPGGDGLTQAATGHKYIVFQPQGGLIVAPAAPAFCCSRRPGRISSFLLMLVVVGQNEAGHGIKERRHRKQQEALLCI